MTELERYLFDLQGFLVVEDVPAHESWGRAGRSDALLARLSDRQRQVLEPPYIWKRQPIPTEEAP